MGSDLKTRLPNMKLIAIWNVKMAKSEDIFNFLNNCFPKLVEQFNFNPNNELQSHWNIEDFVGNEENMDVFLDCISSVTSVVRLIHCSFNAETLVKLFSASSRAIKLSLLSWKFDIGEGDLPQIDFNQNDVKFNIKYLDLSGSGNESNSDWGENRKVLQTILKAICAHQTFKYCLKKIFLYDCGASFSDLRKCVARYGPPTLKIDESKIKEGWFYFKIV